MRPRRRDRGLRTPTVRVVGVGLVLMWLVVAGVGGTSPLGADPAPGNRGADSAVAAAPTPVFSARRLPVLVQSLRAAPELTASLLPLVDDSPTDSCMSVDVAGRRLFGAGLARPLVPASNQKIVTAQLALDVLGADHRFRTEVVATSPTSGVIDGDLYLVGGGDPVLRTKAYTDYLGAEAGGSTSLEALADAVVAKGVRRVSGGVIGDESRYDSLRSVPGWPDRYLEQHQLGPLSALGVNQGFTSFPETFDEDALSQLTATDDPPRFAAETFADLLRARGVQIDGPPGVGVAPSSGLSRLATAVSPPLTDIVGQLLNRSDNQIAELLVKEAGRVDGKGGTTRDGLAVFHDALGRLDLPTQGVAMHDGSGLGYDNRLTCAVLAALLHRAGANSVIADGLAVGGQTGTLRERFTDPVTKGRIRAKTGTLNDVTALSGFADPSGGKPLVFAYIANGAVVTPDLLAIQEQLGKALVGYGATVPLGQLGPR